MGPDCVPSSTISVLPQSRKTTSTGVAAGVARLPPARLAGGCRCVSAGLAVPVSAAGSTRRTPSATATPMAQPAATSDGQCTARYMRDSPMPSAKRPPPTSTGQRQRVGQAMRMSAAANAVALIVCPLGNAYFDGWITPGMPPGGVRRNTAFSSGVEARRHGHGRDEVAGVPAAAGEGEQHREGERDGPEYPPEARPGERQPCAVEQADPVVVEPGDDAAVQPADGVGADQGREHREREQQKQQGDREAAVRPRAAGVPAAVVSSRHR